MEKEELINKIIEIDKEAREQIQKEKELSIHMQAYVEEEFAKEKKQMDDNYKKKLDLEKQKYADKFTEEKQKIDFKIKMELENIVKVYKENEQNIIEENFKKIKCGEE